MKALRIGICGAVEAGARRVRGEVLDRSKWLAALLAAMVLTGCVATKSTELPPDLAMLSRKDWGANAPVAEMKRHQLTHITIHHTAVKQNPSRSLIDKLQALQKFSQNEGKLASGRVKPPWPDVPYHYYIDCLGQLAEAREVRFVGDTNTEYDPTGHILVVLEGNFEEEPVTAAQLETLRTFVAWLAARWDVPVEKIQTHKDYAKTQCPGRNLENYMPELRAHVASAGGRGPAYRQRGVRR